MHGLSSAGAAQMSNMMTHDIERDKAAMKLMSVAELVDLCARLRTEITDLAQRDLLTRRGIALFLGVSARTIEYHLRKGNIPRPDFQLGRRKYWTRSKLITWLQQNQVGGEV